MPTQTFVPTTSTVAPLNEAQEVVRGTAVLDRIARRVRQRLANEQIGDAGAGAHAASLIWPWPA